MRKNRIGQYLDYSLFSVSANGILAYWSPGSVDSQLTWFDPQGKVLSTVGEPGPYLAFALSPDGTRAIFSKLSLPSGHAALWLLDPSRGSSVRLELGSSVNDIDAVWAPDGRRIIFASNRAGQMDFYEKPMGGERDAEVLMKSNEAKLPLSWSPDGRFLLYVTFGGRPRVICGCFRSGTTTSRCPSFKPSSMSPKAVFLPTAIGSPIRRMSQAVLMSIFDVFRRTLSVGQSRVPGTSG